MPTAQPLVKPQHTCRICMSEDLAAYVDFGDMPLANRNLSRAELSLTEPVFPLRLLLCRQCRLSQLGVVVSPQLLYQDYPYYSSVSLTFQDHCRAMVAALTARLSLRPGDLVVEIASNDGCLMSKFAEAGFRTAGVEPAGNLAFYTNAKGLATFCAFWGEDVAHEIKRQFGSPALIVGTNVMAHVDDVHGFLRAVRAVLSSQGHFVFEVPYMGDYIEQLEFDTTYHEHLSYFLLHPLKRVLEANGFRLVDVEKFNMHGGSIRVTCCKDSAPHAAAARVAELLRWEEQQGLLNPAVYEKFASRIQVVRGELRRVVASLKARGKSIAAYGASAKGNVLLNYCGIGRGTIAYIVDDTPAKQGRFQSGTHIPIVAQSHMRQSRPDYLLILAWNFSEELMHKTAAYHKAGGSYIIPLPQVRVIDAACPNPTETVPL